MSKISLKHSGGNVVSLNSPTNAPSAADVAFKLPNADGSDGQALVTDGSGNLSFGNVAGGSARNLIINGAMLVAQRGTSSTDAGYSTIDRINRQVSGTDESPTFAQVDVASGTTPYTLGFRKCLKITNGDQTSGAGASDYLYFWYILEAQDVANSGWNYTSASSYITISYWVRSSVSQNFYGMMQTADGTAQNYVWETGSLTADTWTKITKTIPGNSNLQFDNDVNAGLYIAPIRVFDGTDRTASMSLNTWAAYSGSSRTPDQTPTWYTTNDATLEVTGLQLEVGSVATDFEHRSFAQELALCQRYLYVAYIKESGHSGKYALPSNVAMWNTTSPYMNMSFPNQMRTTPSLSMFNVSSAIQIPFSSPSTVNVSTLYLSYAHRQGTLLYGSGSGGAGVAGQTSNGYIQSDNLSVGQGIFFSAEL